MLEGVVEQRTPPSAQEMQALEVVQAQLLVGSMAAEHPLQELVLPSLALLCASTAEVMVPLEAASETG